MYAIAQPVNTLYHAFHDLNSIYSCFHFFYERKGVACAHVHVIHSKLTYVGYCMCISNAQ